MDPRRSRMIALLDACEEEEGELGEEEEGEGELGAEEEGEGELGEEEEGAGGSAGRWSSASQALRSIRGWEKRRRRSAGSRQELQSLRHNVEHAVRSDDLMVPKLGKKRGSGSWKEWTPRRVLDVAFQHQSMTLRGSASKIQNASHQHISDLKSCVASSVDKRLKEERQKILTPSRPHGYLIETVMHDETGLKLQPFQKHCDVIPVQNAAVSYCISADELAAEPTFYPVPLKLAPMPGKTAGDCLGALCWQLQDKAWAGPPASAAEFVGLSLGSDGAEALLSLLVCLTCRQSFRSIVCCCGHCI